MSTFLLRCMLLVLSIAHVSAMSWRIFVGREDCVTESIPENQLEMLRESFRRRNSEIPDKLNVAVDVGFLVTNQYGGETGRGTVDVTARSATGDNIYSNTGVKEDTFSVVSRGPPEGWEVCFKISSTDGGTQPLTIELSFFTVNMRALIGTEHEKSKDNIQADTSISIDVDIETLAKSEDLGKVVSGLRSSNLQLTTLRQMGHHLRLRTERHMKTVQSTHRRTLVWSGLLTLALVSASLFQVYAVQKFFNSTGKINRV